VAVPVKGQRVFCDLDHNYGSDDEADEWCERRHHVRLPRVYGAWDNRDRSLPPSGDGCTCDCHAIPGIKHVEACCSAP
jgi:hypothetical protein